MEASIVDVFMVLFGIINREDELLMKTSVT